VQQPLAHADSVPGLADGGKAAGSEGQEPPEPGQPPGAGRAPRAGPGRAAGAVPSAPPATGRAGGLGAGPDRPNRGLRAGPSPGGGAQSPVQAPAPLPAPPPFHPAAPCLSCWALTHPPAPRVRYSCTRQGSFCIFYFFLTYSLGFVPK